MYATTKSTTVEPPAVTLAIDLAKDVFELAFIDAAGLNDDLGSSTAKPGTRMQPPRLARVETNSVSRRKPKIKNAVKLVLHKPMSSGVDRGVHT